MRKSDLAIRLARHSRLSPAQAADQLDRVVHDILTTIREGKEAALPGLGRFLPDEKSGLHFEKALKPVKAKRG